MPAPNKEKTDFFLSHWWKVTGDGIWGHTPAQRDCISCLSLIYMAYRSSRKIKSVCQDLIFTRDWVSTNGVLVLAGPTLDIEEKWTCITPAWDLRGLTWGNPERPTSAPDRALWQALCRAFYKDFSFGIHNRPERFGNMIPVFQFRKLRLRGTEDLLRSWSVAEVTL